MLAPPLVALPLGSVLCCFRQPMEFLLQHGGSNLSLFCWRIKAAPQAAKASECGLAPSLEEAAALTCSLIIMPRRP